MFFRLISTYVIFFVRLSISVFRLIGGLHLEDIADSVFSAVCLIGGLFITVFFSRAFRVFILFYLISNCNLISFEF